jgi:hypothetical protein
MNELEFARFIKSSLGAPRPAPMLASRIAAEISARGPSSDIGGSTVRRAERGIAQRTGAQRGARRSTARRAAYRVGGAALALGLIGALNLAGVYYLPWYGTALANAPLVGPLFAHPPHPPFAHPDHTPAPSHH